jgi:threonine/homoserine/homoserine lactone efflux protein
MTAVITPAFIISSAIVIMTPGPDLAFITRKVIRHGRRPALASAAGMISAGALQAGAGFAGLALLLRTDPVLLTALRWAGAAVLCAFGVLAFRGALRPAGAVAPLAVPEVARNSYWQGMACTGSNPKVGIFLVAYLPQFLPAGTVTGQAVAELIATYLGIGLAWLVLWTSFVHQVSRVVLAPRMLRIADLLVGVVLVAFGARLALIS